MGRAMLIICAGLLISMGFISINTSNTGKMLTQQTVNYAEYTMAKNAAHTAIQMATQKINKDEDWPLNHHSEETAWVTTVQGLEVRLHTDYEDNDYWTTQEHDKLWFYSRAQLGAEFGNRIVEVRSHYRKRPFYELVPEFTGAIQLPTGYNSFSVSGNAHGINGIAEHCDENKPPITVSKQEYKDNLPDDLNTNGGEVLVDPTLSYEPTDELIERLENSGNAITVDSDFGTNLGTADNPGIFFVEGNVKLSGQQKEGYGILVIRSNNGFEWEDGGNDEESSLDVSGNFTFNGLVIFENAFNFDGRGTPTINGSVLIGNTEGNEGTMDIDYRGNINVNYDCNGEMYAKMAADQAVQQNKYTLLVSTENLRYN